ncbi:hypothetical protein ACQ27_gp614 [Klebsiella phage K64-1]|nr:hypothetical protein ACQ27_gp614 [Klebsiella phage K64-1]
MINLNLSYKTHNFESIKFDE